MGRKPKANSNFRILDVTFTDSEIAEKPIDSHKDLIIARLNKTEFDSDTKKRFLDVMEVFTNPNSPCNLLDRANAARRIISLIDIAELKDPTY